MPAENGELRQVNRGNFKWARISNLLRIWTNDEPCEEDWLNEALFVWLTLHEQEQVQHTVIYGSRMTVILVPKP
jgi:hypothetical protein